MGAGGLTDLADFGDGVDSSARGGSDSSNCLYQYSSTSESTWDTYRQSKGYNQHLRPPASPFAELPPGDRNYPQWRLVPPGTPNLGLPPPNLSVFTDTYKET
jgi:hypothetical protein